MIMKNSLKGSETEKNLRRALEGEALAHLKYQFYKSVVSDYSKEFENILDEIIHNEKEHGKIWFKQLHGGEMPSSYMSMVDSMSYHGSKTGLYYGIEAGSPTLEDIVE